MVAGLKTWPEWLWKGDERRDWMWDPMICEGLPLPAAVAASSRLAAASSEVNVAPESTESAEPADRAGDGRGRGRPPPVANISSPPPEPPPSEPPPAAAGGGGGGGGGAACCCLSGVFRFFHRSNTCRPEFAKSCRTAGSSAALPLGAGSTTAAPPSMSHAGGAAAVEARGRARR